MFGGGVGRTGPLRLLPCGRTRENQPTEAPLAHATDRKPRKLEWPIEVDPHRLAPHLWILLPHEALMSRADTVVDDENVDRAQAVLGFGDGVSASGVRAEIRGDVFEPDALEFRRGA